MLDALWARRSATVRELVEGGCDDLAYTTVMTTLDRLFKKSLLSREPEGRALRGRNRHRRDGERKTPAGSAVEAREGAPSLHAAVNQAREQGESGKRRRSTAGAWDNRHANADDKVPEARGVDCKSTALS